MVTGSSRKTLARLLESNPWVYVLNLPELGRGLISSTCIPRGTVIHSELPIVSCLPLGKHGCRVCLSPSGSGDVPQCCDDGDIMSKRGYGAGSPWRRVEDSCTWDPLLEYTASTGEKFPLLVARLACMRMSRSVYGDDCVSVDDRDMENLCFANMSHIPDSWKESHQALLRCFPNKERIENLISVEWYTDMMSRVHPNAFRVDLIDTGALEQDYATALRRMFVEQESESGNGSAVYLLSSLFNHSCSPNVEPVFPHNNHIVEMRALRDIEKNEHLSISYIDSNLSYEERQHKLLHGYGFQCRCEKCLEESS